MRFPENVQTSQGKYTANTVERYGQISGSLSASTDALYGVNISQREAESACSGKTPDRMDDIHSLVNKLSGEKLVY